MKRSKKNQKFGGYTWTTGDITDIVESNRWYEGCEKYKNVFKCRTSRGETLCVAWEYYPNLDAGDFVTMEGRLANEVFLVRKMLIDKKERTRGD